MSVEERVSRLEVRMDKLERETEKQTIILEKQSDRLFRIERVLWMTFGAVGIVEFGIRILEIFKK